MSKSSNRRNSSSCEGYKVIGYNFSLFNKKMEMQPAGVLLNEMAAQILFSPFHLMMSLLANCYVVCFGKAPLIFVLDE